MKDSLKKSIAVIEIAFVYMLLLIQIWSAKASLLITLLIVGTMIVSWIFHKNDLHSIGLLPKNLKGLGAVLAIAIVALSIVNVMVFLAKNGFDISSETFTKTAGLALKNYKWVLLQQLILNGFFVNRVSSIASKNWTPVVCAVLFSTLHLPNLFLASVTLVGGFVFVKLFERSKNLYLIALLHVAVACYIYAALPYSLHHDLNIGRKY